MSIEQAIREELATISGLDTNNIYPLNAPENAPFPFLVYYSEAGKADNTLMGFLSSTSYDIELHLLYDDYAGMRTITSGVVQRLQSFARRMIGTTNQYLVQELDYHHSPSEVWDTQNLCYRTIISFTIYI